MTFDEAHWEFLKQKEAGLDPLIVRRAVGPAPKDATDFEVVDRLTEIHKLAQKEC